jgi:hypothetical protein
VSFSGENIDFELYFCSHFLVLSVIYSSCDPGTIFYGCWFSTFTGYINRLRGYHTDDHQLPGFREGIIPSYYYALEDRFDHMQSFYPVKKSFYAREFPTSWRLIDASIEEELLGQPVTSQ